jgi:hypothetical protein
LRKLCIESGKSVVIADQIPAKGKEAKEDNEIGRVLPMTASGLEYFVDVMVEVSMQERDGEIARVFQIVKSNSPAFEVGFEMTGNIGFKDFLDHMKAENALELAFDKPAKSEVPEFIEENAPLSIAPQIMTVDDLIKKAEENGFKSADIVTGAKIYHNQPNIYHLTSEQIADLDRRMSARAAKIQADPKEEKSVKRIKSA